MMIQHDLAGLASKRRAEGHGFEIKFSSWRFSRMPTAVKICYNHWRLTGVRLLLSGNEIVTTDRSAVAASPSGPLDLVLR
jgi:hypothetical protein